MFILYTRMKKRRVERIRGNMREQWVGKSCWFAYSEHQRKNEKGAENGGRKLGYLSQCTTKEWGQNCSKPWAWGLLSLPTAVCFFFILMNCLVSFSKFPLNRIVVPVNGHLKHIEMEPNAFFFFFLPKVGLSHKICLFLFVVFFCFICQWILIESFSFISEYHKTICYQSPWGGRESQSDIFKTLKTCVLLFFNCRKYYIYIFFYE